MRKQTNIKIYCTESERDAIKAQADNHGRSLSSYVKDLALEHKMMSIIDAAHLIEINKHAGDLGRLGGLLKLCLSKADSVKGNSPRVFDAEVRAVLHNIEASQALLHKASNRLTRDIEF